VSVSTVILTCVLAAVGAADPPAPDVPTLDQLRGFYGDTHNIEMLGDLLTDDDPVVRVWAAHDLGQTHNPAALPPLRIAFGDDDALVRAAAVQAAAELPDDAGRTLLLAALDDRDVRVVLAALPALVASPADDATAGLLRLLDHDDVHLQVAALRALTTLGHAVPPDRLRQLLADRSISLRLRAAENAVLSDASAALVDHLTDLTGEDQPQAIRAAALAALGKLAFGPSAARITAAARSTDPQIRRGALWAYRNAGRADKVAPFLDDPFAMVRLAAIRAAGVLKAADGVERLYRLMLDSPLGDDAHDAARDALIAIGNDDVAAGAADTYRRLLADEESGPLILVISGRDKQKQALLARNAGACALILGHLHSRVGIDDLLATVPKLNCDSPVAGDLVEALGLLGDERAIPPLTGFLRKCVKFGPIWLAESMKTIPKYVPYNDRFAARAIEALGRLGAADTLEIMLPLAYLRIQHTALPFTPGAIARAMPSLYDPHRRDAYETAAGNLLANPSDEMVQFMAARIAGQYKLQKLLPELQRLLDDLRPNPYAIAAAAWAIGRITGNTPDPPEARPNESVYWIVRRAKPRP